MDRILFSDSFFVKSKISIDGGINCNRFRMPEKNIDENLDKLQQFIKTTIWDSPTLNDEVDQICREELGEIGIDFDSLALARGRSVQKSELTKKQIEDLENKERADLAESIGFLIQRDFYEIKEEDIYARNIQGKLSWGLSLPGIDGICILITEKDEIRLSDNDKLMICEWKHTVNSVISAPCKSINDFFVKKLTIHKLYQELKVIKRFLRTKDKQIAAEAVKLFLPEFAKKTKKIVLSSMILFDDNLKDSIIKENIQDSLIPNLVGNWATQSLQVDVFGISDLINTCKKIYEIFYE